jgi:hypothetical protein
VTNSRRRPTAVVQPAKSHPEVIIAAVAARDLKKAKAFAKKHGIAIVHKSYQGWSRALFFLGGGGVIISINWNNFLIGITISELIEDPAIDAIYIPLPNGLHYEWALKSLQLGKHVLLEKPSTSNATEATSLFRHELLREPNAPVLLEAVHVLFHPAWQTFLTLVDSQNIAAAHAVCRAPSLAFSKDDIRFDYDLAGGAMMDCGTYCAFFLRQIFGTEPVECLEATPRIMPAGRDQKVDQAMQAKWRFPNGGIGSIDADLSAPLLSKLPWCEAVHKEKVIQDQTLSEDSGKEHVVIRRVLGTMMMMPVICRYRGRKLFPILDYFHDSDCVNSHETVFIEQSLTPLIPRASD